MTNLQVVLRLFLEGGGGGALDKLTEYNQLRSQAGTVVCTAPLDQLIFEVELGATLTDAGKSGWHQKKGKEGGGICVCQL